MKVALILRHVFPGKYAFVALAGALEQLEDSGELALRFARDRAQMLELAQVASNAGEQVVLAFSFYSPGCAEAFDDLRWLRERLAERQVLFIAGGVHATAEPEETLREGFDLVAVGEGEKTLVELVRRLCAGESLDALPGTSRLVDGRVRSFGKGELVSLDEWPPFNLRHEKFGAIEITRGCIYACRFCQTPFINKARFRHRSVENVAKWARALRASGRRDLRFISPTSLSYGSPDESPNLEAVEALLVACREAMGPEGRIYFGTFPSEVRPEHVTPEALRLLKRYIDNDNLIIGGQSGSDRVLASSHRGHDVASIVRAVEVSAAEGFLPNVDFILGLPGESCEDVNATLDLMEQLASLGAKVHGHTFMPLPGTPFKREPPGQFDASTQLRLEQLASKGGLYGQWKKQAEIAREMAERRDRRAAR